MLNACHFVILYESLVGNENFVYLSNDVVDDLVNGKSNVGMNGEHLSQSIFILSGIQVSIQQAAYHIQEGWVILL